MCEREGGKSELTEERKEKGMGEENESDHTLTLCPLSRI